MAKYYMKEENLTSIADSIRDVYVKSGELTCADMARDLKSVKNEVGEQAVLIDKISSKFFDKDIDKILEGTIESYSNSNITSIGEFAFYGCNVLTTVNLPNVIDINSSAFMYCQSLTTVDLSSVIDISYRAFYNCTSLTTIIIRTDRVCFPDLDVFYNTPIASGAGYIYVPKSLIENYKTATLWSTYKSRIRAIEDYPDICGQEVVE